MLFMDAVKAAKECEAKEKAWRVDLPILSTISIKDTWMVIGVFGDDETGLGEVYESDQHGMVTCVCEVALIGRDVVIMSER